MVPSGAGASFKKFNLRVKKPPSLDQTTQERPLTQRRPPGFLLNPIQLQGSILRNSLEIAICCPQRKAGMYGSDCDDEIGQRNRFALPGKLVTQP